MVKMMGRSLVCVGGGGGIVEWEEEEVREGLG